MSNRVKGKTPAMNIKDLLPKLLLSIQKKAMKNKDSVSLRGGRGGGGGGWECFDIRTPVLLFLVVYSLWFSPHVCKNVYHFCLLDLDCFQDY